VRDKVARFHVNIDSLYNVSDLISHLSPAYHGLQFMQISANACILLVKTSETSDRSTAFFLLNSVIIIASSDYRNEFKYHILALYGTSDI